MPSGWNGHIRGEKHKKRAAAAQARTTRPSNTSQAPVRPAGAPSRRNRNRAGNGRAARASVPQNQPPITPPITPTPPEHVLCEVCGRRIHRDDTERHNQRDRGHLDMLRKLEVEQELRSARSDKHGISVTQLDGVDFGVIEPGQTDAVHRVITVRGLNENPTISLTDLNVSSALFFSGSDSSFVSTTLCVCFIDH